MPNSSVLWIWEYIIHIYIYICKVFCVLRGAALWEEMISGGQISFAFENNASLNILQKRMNWSISVYDRSYAPCRCFHTLTTHSSFNERPDFTAAANPFTVRRAAFCSGVQKGARKERCELWCDDDEKQDNTMKWNEMKWAGKRDAKGKDGKQKGREGKGKEGKGKEERERERYQNVCSKFYILSITFHNSTHKHLFSNAHTNNRMSK